jgi:hypothetical protein
LLARKQVKQTGTSKIGRAYGDHMTEAEARNLCAQLAREHPERAENQWFPREGDEGWTVVKVRLPEGLRRPPMTPTTKG